MGCNTSKTQDRSSPQQGGAPAVPPTDLLRQMATREMMTLLTVNVTDHPYSLRPRSSRSRHSDSLLERSGRQNQPNAVVRHPPPGSSLGERWQRCVEQGGDLAAKAVVSGPTRTNEAPLLSSSVATTTPTPWVVTVLSLLFSRCEAQAQVEEEEKEFNTGGDCIAENSHVVSTTTVRPLFDALHWWEICMQRYEYSIDFTQHMDVYNANLLMQLSRCGSIAASRLLSAVLKRWKDRPGLDNVNWDQRDLDGLNVVETYAQYGLLSIMWPLLRALPEFSASGSKKIALKVPLFLTDWAAMRVEDQHRFVLSTEQEEKGIRSAASALREISTWGYTQSQLIDVQVVKKLIRELSCNCEKPRSDREKEMVCESFFNFAESFGECVKLTACAKLCLQVPFPLNFSSESGTIARLLCRTPREDVSALELTCCMVDRLATHPYDKFDWGSVFGPEDDPCDFIGTAARCGRLALLWPVLKARVPYFAKHEGPIPIRYCSVLPWEWVGLQPEQPCFRLLRGVMPALEAAAWILQRCMSGDRQKSIDSAEVTTAASLSRRLCPYKAEDDRKVSELLRVCCESGLDVGTYLMDCSGRRSTTVLYSLFLACGPLSVTVALRYCRRPINWMKPVSKGELTFSTESLGFFFAFLKLFRYCGYQVSEAGQLLQAIADRLSTHPADMVDWSLEDNEAHDLLSLMAQAGVLSYWWLALSSSYRTGNRQNHRVSSSASIFRFPRRVRATPVRLLDLRRMPGAEASLEFSMGILDATEELVEFALRNETPNFTDVDALLACGAVADEMRLVTNGPEGTIGGVIPLSLRGGGCNAMLAFATFERADCLLQCIEGSAKSQLDFTLTNALGETVLHLLCKWSCASQACKVLQRIVKRQRRTAVGKDPLQQHLSPRHSPCRDNAVANGLMDQLEWAQKAQNGLDFFAYAANYGLLSLFWPIVEETLHQKVTRPLESLPMLTDWEALGRSGQQAFEPKWGNPLKGL